MEFLELPHGKSRTEEIGSGSVLSPFTVHTQNCIKILFQVSVYISPIEPAAQGKQDRLFKVQDLDSSIENFAIRKVEVFEDYRSHHLLVVTEDKVLQVLITYPEQVTACYD